MLRPQAPVPNPQAQAGSGGRGMPVPGPQAQTPCGGGGMPVPGPQARRGGGGMLMPELQVGGSVPAPVPLLVLALVPGSGGVPMLGLVDGLSFDWTPGLLQSLLPGWTSRGLQDSRAVLRLDFAWPPGLPLGVASLGLAWTPGLQARGGSGGGMPVPVLALQLGIGSGPSSQDRKGAGLPSEDCGEAAPFEPT